MRAKWASAAALLVLCTSAALAQRSGVRGLLIDYQFEYGDVRSVGQGIGLGFDHDVLDQLSFGVDITYQDHGEAPRARESQVFPGDLYSFELIYRAAFTPSDNERTAFYIGSWIGLRRFTYTNAYSEEDEPRSVMNVPFGVRLGVRGGLERSYADIYVGLGYKLGGRLPLQRPDGVVVDRMSLNGAEVRFGIAFGVGWEKDDGR